MTIAFIEVVREGTPDRVLAADIIKVPIQELVKAKEEFKKTGLCLCATKRRFIEDEKGWIYDFRSCAVCGRGLGTV